MARPYPMDVGARAGKPAPARIRILETRQCRSDGGYAWPPPCSEPVSRSSSLTALHRSPAACRAHRMAGCIEIVESRLQRPSSALEESPTPDPAHDAREREAPRCHSSNKSVKTIFALDTTRFRDGSGRERALANPLAADRPGSAPRAVFATSTRATAGKR